ncbi:MAG TPA: aminoacyl-histidine dipeptidase [Sphaerochaeta sp.]|nr:aminoacyl-histidine dipeptidase [Sphaerochaeta sp.]
MQDAVRGIAPQSVWKYFSDISSIPRESGNEAGMQAYLTSFAKEHSLDYTVDGTGNVIIRKEAAPGFESKPSVALQGHMDMVCVKDEGVVHDFATDPLTLVRDGDILKAQGTTLGADNGIAVALILSILGDTEALHGPLEGIFTVEEETGLTGAFGLEERNIKSRLLINLDSEEEGIFYIGCAGGIETRVTKAVNWKETEQKAKAFLLTAGGMQGGHSGGEIHKQRANAIKAAARVLTHLPSFSLFSAEGGTKRNVIPSLAKFGFVIDAKDEQLLFDTLTQVQEELKSEYEYADPDLTLTLQEAEKPAMVVDRSESKQFITALYAAPHGVDAMSMSIPGIVETSTNLAIISLDKEHAKVIASHRSSILSSRDDVAKRFGAIFSLIGADVTFEGAYPSWKPNPHSKLTAFCAKAYEEYTGKEPVVTAIHAGLECGIINSRVEGMDSVSFGPTMWDVHSTKERISISSVAWLDGFTRHLLEIIE